MVYIPDTWFKDTKNQDIVFDLFNGSLDIKDVGQKETIALKLKELGELVILEHYENNDISL